MSMVDGNNPRNSRSGALKRWRSRALAVAGVLVVFTAAAGIGHMVKDGKRNEVKTPTGAVAGDTFAIADAGAPTPVIIVLYDDMRSSASKRFMTTYGPTLEHMVTTGQVHLQHRFVTSSDTRLGGDGAAKAANALACAQDGKKFPEYLQVLWENQPKESDDAFADNEHLIRLAKQVDGLDPATFNPCVRLDKHHGWVQAGQRDFLASGLGGTPVLTVNDQPVRVKHLTPAKLTRIVRAAVRDAGAAW
jgi:protein-disulfide isomerase